MKKLLCLTRLSVGTLATGLLLMVSCTKVEKEDLPALNAIVTPVPALAQKNWEKLPGRYVVKFKNTQPISNGRLAASYDEQVDDMKRVAAEYLQKLGVRNAIVIHGYVGDFQGFAFQLKDQADIGLVENDPQDLIEYIAEDRWLSRINPVGEITTYSAEAFAATFRGQELPFGIRRVAGPQIVPMRRAYVLDGGVDLDHPDLKVDLRLSRSFVTTNPVDAATPDDLDPVGHGTHVAGTIAARNDGKGVVGVAADANIIAVKVLSRFGSGPFSDIIAGVNYVANVGRSGDVVNLSLGAGPIALDVIANNPISVAFRQVCESAAVRGIFMVYAAGNSGLPAQFFIPAAYKGTNMWTIAAKRNDDQFPGFTNWGPLIDYTEPGVAIISTYPGGGYAVLSGTSMAAPHFSGIVLVTGGYPQDGGNVLNAAARPGTPSIIGVIRN